MPEFATNPSNSLLRYDGLFVAAHHAKHGKADADAEKGKGRGLRDRDGCGGSYEAVGSKRAVLKSPDDLPRVVDAESERLECARHVDLGEAAAGIKEAVERSTQAVLKITDDLPRVVDAIGARV
jgi:hypothetical protein